MERRKPEAMNQRTTYVAQASRDAGETTGSE
jgi:hypothetical protein